MQTDLKQFLECFPQEPHYYANAGHVFYDIMNWIQENRPKSKPNIIMPAYIPAKLYRFILAAGYKPKFYDVSTELDFSVDEIRSLIDDQTQMVFAIHYFGIPVDLDPLKQLTQEQDLFLFEDCAHTLNGSWQGKTLGTTGDFAIFSIRKMLQLHCGGFLMLNKQPWPFQPSRTKKVSNFFTGYHIVGSRIKYSLNRLSRGRNLFQKISIPEIGYIDFNEKQTVTVKRMDRLSQWYLSKSKLSTLIEKRRENVRFLWNHIRDLETFAPIGFDRLSEINNTVRHSNSHSDSEIHNSQPAESSADQKYQLINGYVPFSLPILTLAGTREFIQKELLNCGIMCYIGWSEAPFGMKEFRKAEQLQSRLLELPVHHYINQYQLDTMADCLNGMKL